MWNQTVANCKPRSPGGGHAQGVRSRVPGTPSVLHRTWGRGSPADHLMLRCLDVWLPWPGRAVIRIEHRRDVDTLDRLRWPRSAQVFRLEACLLGSGGNVRARQTLPPTRAGRPTPTTPWVASAAGRATTGRARTRKEGRRRGFGRPASQGTGPPV